MAYPYRWPQFRYRHVRLWLWPGVAFLTCATAVAAAASIGYLLGKERSIGANANGLPLPLAGARPDFPPSHGLPRGPELVRAFEIAFGRPDEVIRHIGASGEATRFRAGALVQAPFGPVLLSEGQVLAPTAASTGKLAAVYLTDSPRGLRAQSHFLPAIESGSMGRLDEWNVRSDFGNNPVVEVKGAGSSGGLSCAWTTLLELRPEGPFELVTIPMSFDNSEGLLEGSPTRIDGRIRSVVAGRGFEVVYSGSAAFTDLFVREGARYVLGSGGSTRMKSC